MELCCISPPQLAGCHLKRSTNVTFLLCLFFLLPWPLGCVCNMVRCGRLIIYLAHSLLVIDYIPSLCIVVYRVHCMHMFDVTFLIEMVLILFTTLP